MPISVWKSQGQDRGAEDAGQLQLRDGLHVVAWQQLQAQQLQSSSVLRLRPKWHGVIATKKIPQSK